ncbi:leucyl/phenylalanyl-tRNA--protein transferase [Dongshaea marina]|uniref:leucyl/phenylalanyl-tRNA--protein transferase n=1 Tax=Dongshaea marina TaxID=2047966 RepID=UPI000D3ED088|nr:leucyl/phenylalanyl-tRNA--protein transferase [Dongshaea marina]
MPLYQLSSDNLLFPDPCKALEEPNGLLAIGGDLSCQRLLSAYHSGIFPWFESDQPLLWWSPDPRCILRPDRFSPSRSLKRTLRRHACQLWINRDFSQTIQLCAQTHHLKTGTWITEQMIQAYSKLHEQGVAHSIECWDQDTLIGGLYGVSVGQLFCGESMFHLRQDASKLAIWGLCQHFIKHGGQLIDCQVTNPHLERLGAIECSREQFLQHLVDLKQKQVAPECWELQQIQL